MFMKNLSRILAIVFFLFSISSICFSETFDTTNTKLKQKPVPPIPAGLPYSFTREPFINPKIIEDLSTWLSDGGDQVIAINLTESQKSNRYSEKTISRWLNTEHPYVGYEGENSEHDPRPPFFGYQYIGTIDSNVYVLQISSGGGGSGIFENLLLVTLEKDYGLGNYFGDTTYKDTIRLDNGRILIKKIGEIALGDRYQGELRIEGNKIFIGNDEGVQGKINGRENDEHSLVIDLHAKPADSLANPNKRRRR
jgi:hypothetical protein